jgi:hypothetical protein
VGAQLQNARQGRPLRYAGKAEDRRSRCLRTLRRRPEAEAEDQETVASGHRSSDRPPWSRRHAKADQSRSHQMEERSSQGEDFAGAFNVDTKTILLNGFRASSPRPMVGEYNRDTSSVTATPSTVTSSSAAFGRWAFGIGQLGRDRRGRTGIVKGRSVRSGGNVLTTLSCSASGIFAICCDLTRPTITRLARTFRSTRTRRRREPYIPLVAFCLRHFLADFIICMYGFDFRQAQLQAGNRESAHHAAASPTRTTSIGRTSFVNAK